MEAGRPQSRLLGAPTLTGASSLRSAPAPSISRRFCCQRSRRRSRGTPSIAHRTVAFGRIDPSLRNAIFKLCGTVRDLRTAEFSTADQSVVPVPVYRSWKKKIQASLYKCTIPLRIACVRRGRFRRTHQSLSSICGRCVCVYHEMRLVESYSYACILPGPHRRD